MCMVSRMRRPSQHAAPGRNPGTCEPVRVRGKGRAFRVKGWV